jgi:1-deoxy-D-xylulose-5-phosphate reductoisomerase
MRLPIALGLTWPERLADVAPACDWTTAHTWTFDPLDDEAFPAVSLARAAGTAGGTAPAVFNAANEVAVDAFRTGELSFPGIVDTIAAVLGEHAWAGGELTVDAVLAADAAARVAARRVIMGASAGIAGDTTVAEPGA